MSGAENIFRNSSTKRGGFRGNVGFTSTSSNIDVDGSEDIMREQDLLTDADRVLLRDNIKTLTDCVVTAFCADRTELKSKAQWAWDRAVSLYPTTKALMDAEMLVIRDEAIDRICAREAMWARTAGSSLNCIVQGMKNRAEIELAKELTGVMSKYLTDLKQHETQAVSQAFADNMSANMETTRVAFAQIGALYGILRGANVTEVTDRDYTEDRSENTTVIDARGEFYHEATSISDDQNTYAADAADAFTASQAVAGTVNP